MAKTIVSAAKITASETARIAVDGGVGPTIRDTFNGTEGNDSFDGRAGDDVLFGFGGNDTLIGGNQGDLIFGGEGDDWIETGRSRTNSFDTAYGGEGNDTIFGGLDNDTLYGGAGDDTILNTGTETHAEYFDGGTGADRLILTLDQNADPYVIIGGPNEAADGNDTVQVSGKYEITTVQLGHGNDTFIGNLNAEQALEAGNSDRVAGGAGDDVISAWWGKDVLVGGDGNDALWGGDGDDIVDGGDGTDFIYGGTGTDTLYGGASTDHYFWSREDGMGDQIYDQYRMGGSGENNGILVYGIFSEDGTLKSGTGVFETDHDITNKTGMVRVYDIEDDDTGADLWRLEIISGEGEGNYVDFDRRDISQIALSNHEAPVGQGVQRYVWDGTTYSYWDGLSIIDETDPPLMAPPIG